MHPGLTTLAAPLAPLQGLYTEMDFRNEALNAQRMAQLLGERCGAGVGASVLREPTYGCPPSVSPSSHDIVPFLSLVCVLSACVRVGPWG